MITSTLCALSLRVCARARLVKFIIFASRMRRLYKSSGYRPQIPASLSDMETLIDLNDSLVERIVSLLGKTLINFMEG